MNPNIPISATKFWWIQTYVVRIFLFTTFYSQSRVQGIPAPAEEDLDFLNFPVFSNFKENKRYRRQEFDEVDPHENDPDFCELPPTIDPTGK